MRDSPHRLRVHFQFSQSTYSADLLQKSEVPLILPYAPKPKGQHLQCQDSSFRI